MPKKRAFRRMPRHPVTQPSDPSYLLIPLTQGQNAIVDAVDYDRLMQFNFGTLLCGRLVLTVFMPKEEKDINTFVWVGKFLAVDQNKRLTIGTTTHSTIAERTSANVRAFKMFAIVGCFQTIPVVL